MIAANPPTAARVAGADFVPTATNSPTPQTDVPVVEVLIPGTQVPVTALYPLLIIGGIGYGTYRLSGNKWVGIATSGGLGYCLYEILRNW
jgi:hypothetical protein